MPFDIIGAKNAGFSDSEIAKEMSGKYGFDYSGASKSGFTDQEIIGEMLSKSDVGTSNDSSYVDYGNPNATPAQIEAGRRKFVDDTAEPITQVKEVLKTAGGYLGNAVKNAPRSIGNLTGNIATSIVHPIDTGTNIVNALSGAVGAALPGIADAPPEGQAAFNALKDTYSQRYGGLNNIAQTFANDPVGLLADAFSLKSLGTAAGRKAGIIAPKTIPPPSVPSPRIGGTAIAAQGDSFGIPTTLGEQLQNPILQKVEVLNEKIPFSGAASFRKTQQAAANTAAKNFLGKYIADSSVPDAALGNDAFINGMYTQVKDLVSEVPNQAISPAKTKAVASSLLDRYPDIFKKLQDTKTEGLVNDIVQGTRPVETPASAVLGPDGLPAIPVSTTPKTLTFDEAWTLRKGLGDKLGQAKKLLANGAIDKTSYSQLSKLFGAVTEDMDSWASSIGKPEIADKFKAANQAYRDYTVKYNIVQKAYDTAVRLTNNGDNFSPQLFSNQLRKIAYKDQQLKNFTSTEIQEMSGLANIMHVVKRAGQFMENPPTGNRLTDVLGIASITKLPTLPAAWATTFLTTTETGQSMLRRASTLSPKSPGMGKLMAELYQIGKIGNSADPQQPDPLGIRNAQ